MRLSASAIELKYLKLSGLVWAVLSGVESSCVLLNVMEFMCVEFNGVKLYCAEWTWIWVEFECCWVELKFRWVEWSGVEWSWMQLNDQKFENPCADSSEDCWYNSCFMVRTDVATGVTRPSDTDVISFLSADITRGIGRVTLETCVSSPGGKDAPAAAEVAAAAAATQADFPTPPLGCEEEPWSALSLPPPNMASTG